MPLVGGYQYQRQAGTFNSMAKGVDSIKVTMRVDRQGKDQWYHRWRDWCITLQNEEVASYQRVLRIPSNVSSIHPIRNSHFASQNVGCPTEESAVLTVARLPRLCIRLAIHLLMEAACKPHAGCIGEILFGLVFGFLVCRETETLGAVDRQITTSPGRWILIHHAGILKQISPLAAGACMTVFEVLSKVVGTVEFFGCVAFPKFVHLLKVSDAFLPILIRSLSWCSRAWCPPRSRKFVTAIATNISFPGSVR